MRLSGLVELTSEIPRDIRERLATGAYRASTAGMVGIALNGLSAGEVNRCLDTVVASETAYVHGVWFLDGAVVTERLLTLARDATFVVAESEAFRGALEQAGIRWMDAAAGDRLLTGWTGRRSTPPETRVEASSGDPRRGALATI